MALMIACPLSPLISLITLASCTFIFVNDFCMCCTARPASLTCRSRKRQMVRTYSHLLLQAERVAHQSVSVQFHQPLALLHVGLPPRHIFSVLCVDQHHLNPMLFENVVESDPIHARRLHRHCVDSACLQPIRHLIQCRRPATKFPHRILIPIRRHRRKMTLITNVDSAGVDMNDRQFRIARCYPPPQIPTLCSVHPSGLQSLKSGHSSLRHAILLDSDSSDPGSARVAKETTDSPAGSCRAFFKADSPPINASQCIAAAEVTLKDGHKAPKRLST